MKRSSLAWYVAMACLGGTLCLGPVVQADSPTTVKASLMAMVDLMLLGGEQRSIKGNLVLCQAP